MARGGELQGDRRRRQPRGSEDPFSMGECVASPKLTNTASSRMKMNHARIATTKGAASGPSPERAASFVDYWSEINERDEIEYTWVRREWLASVRV